MAYYHNKLPDKGAATRMYIRIILLCSLWCSPVVQSKVVSLNNKYLNKQVLQPLQIDKGAFDFGGGRSKREAVTTNKPPVVGGNAGGSLIDVNRTVLSGTERSNQAFVHWMKDSERVFVLTCRLDSTDRSRIQESQLWRSDDYGTTFQKKDHLFESGAKIATFHTFPKNGKKLLFVDIGAKKIYITEDELNSCIPHTVPVEPDVIFPHPSDDKIFLLYSLTQRKLFVTVDDAASFVLLGEDVLPNFYWGDPEYDTSANVVHMEIEGGMPTQAVYKSCIVPSSDDDSKLSPGPFLADSLFVYKEYMFIQKSNLNGSDNYLAVSYKRGPFRRAYFPGDMKTDDFMLLNLDDGQVFIAVNHGDKINLYLSEATGQYYVLSLNDIYHIKRPEYFEIDFHEVRGMNWTFIVNNKEDNEVKTYISFDKGGNWAPLMLNKSCTVESYALSSVLSEENAPGIIVAHGTVGTEITGQPFSVFTSSDGGGTWIKATLSTGAPLMGSFRFSILDQGSILTAVPDGLFTGSVNKTLYYSADVGLHWTQFQFDEVGLIVKGVLTEPGILTMVESVFGHIGSNQPWTIMKVTYDRVLRRCEDKDYKPPWYPKDFNNPSSNNCILGQVVKYKRRNPTSICYNGDTLVHEVESSECECGPEDYECDFGYDENSEGNCEKAAWFNDAYIPAGCGTEGTYLKSQGYRKIPADTCKTNETAHDKYEYQNTTCPVVAPDRLFIISESKNLEAGKEVTFHLEQALGSKFDTKYTWNFEDGSTSEVVVGFETASVRKHIFHQSGHYTVTVIAENSKGKTNASVQIHVQDNVRDIHLIGQKAGKVGIPVVFTLAVRSTASFVPAGSDHVHFVWSFGDEGKGNLPTLTWENSISHVYMKAGSYQISVEAVNSVSSVYKEFSILMLDDVEILQLTFRNTNKYNLSDQKIAEYLLQRMKQQVAEDVGVNFGQLEMVLASAFPAVAHLFIFSTGESGDESVSSIKKLVMDEVNNGGISVYLFGRPSESTASDLIFIDSAKELPVPAGPNLKAVYIAAPILFLAVVVSLVSFLYCRRKMRSLRQYNILHAQDDSDALLDDDEAPLDLNADFGVRESSRDETMLDSGGSHLVMVTGGGSSSDNAENC